MTIKAAREAIRAVADRMKNRIGGADWATVEDWEKELRKAIMLMQGVLASDQPPCRRCGGPTAVRYNKKTGEPFSGCLAFPDCRGPSVSQREADRRREIDARRAELQRARAEEEMMMQIISPDPKSDVFQDTSVEEEPTLESLLGILTSQRAAASRPPPPTPRSQQSRFSRPTPPKPAKPKVVAQPKKLFTRDLDFDFESEDED